MNVVNDYLDILQNIEFAINEIDNNEPKKQDGEVMVAIERLISRYEREQKKLPKLPVPLSGNSLAFFEAMESACEFRMHRTSLYEIQIEDNAMIPVRLIVPILKRLQTSMRLWNGKNKHRGYLNYISNFIV
jgi:hypothetical protein